MSTNKREEGVLVIFVGAFVSLSEYTNTIRNLTFEGVFYRRFMQLMWRTVGMITFVVCEQITCVGYTTIAKRIAALRPTTLGPWSGKPI
jgi:hypothetical protein